MGCEQRTQCDAIADGREHRRLRISLAASLVLKTSELSPLRDRISRTARPIIWKPYDPGAWEQLMARRRQLWKGKTHGGFVSADSGGRKRGVQSHGGSAATARPRIQTAASLEEMSSLSVQSGSAIASWWR
eukprot:2737278-Pyramimonas_sp.AAC.1